MHNLIIDDIYNPIAILERELKTIQRTLSHVQDEDNKVNYEIAETNLKNAIENLKKKELNQPIIANYTDNLTRSYGNRK